MQVVSAHRSGTEAYLILLGRYALVFIRLYLGGWMLLNGLNHFMPIFPQPMGGPPKSSQLMVSLIETGLFDIVKSSEILVGVMLLLDMFVPVALVMAMPISVVVWFNHAILGGKPYDFGSMALGCLAWNVVLLIAYLPHFLPMMRLRAEIGQPADLRHIGAIFAPNARADDAPEANHRVAIAIFGLFLTAFMAYQLHPHTPQSPGAGLTPIAIVNNYMTLAYDEGNRAEAEKMYFSPELTAKEAGLALPKQGQVLKDTILNIIGQGSNVAVYHRISPDGDASALDVVDIYRVAKNHIVEHQSVANQSRP